MRKRLTVLFFILFTCWKVSFSQILPSTSRSDTAVFMLNDKAVNLVSYLYGEPHITFLALHDTEKTGLMAAMEFIRIYGGQAVELKYGNVRNINFTDSLKPFSIDPNRLFTDEGTYMGLAQASEPQIPTGLEEKVRKLGNEVLKFGKVDSLGVIVTLHNNYNGGFSIYSYSPGHYLQSNAEDVYINSTMDPDDFVLVTDCRFFDFLKQKQMNVVLQSTDANDDGSLSVYALQHKIPYANIEVQHGQLHENYRMIVLVNEMLKEMQFPDQPVLITKKNDTVHHQNVLN